MYKCYTQFGSLILPIISLTSVKWITNVQPLICCISHAHYKLTFTWDHCHGFTPALFSMPCLAALKSIKGRMIKSFHLPFCAQPHLVRRWITEKSLEDNLDEISSPQWWNPIAIKTRHKLLLWNTHLSSLLLLSISVGDFIFPVSLNGLNYLLILVCSQ